MPSPLSTATAVVRRYLVLIVAMLLAASALTILAAAPARAAVETAQNSGISYSADPDAPDAGATVTGYDGSAGTDVTIPNSVTIGGTPYAVTAIGDFVFHRNQLTSVTLPESLTTIGNWAFAENRLASVTLPNTLTSIGNGAFHNNGLTTVTLPDSLTTVSDTAFQNNELASVTLPNALTTVGIGAFLGNQLTSVTLPSTLTTIGNGAFNQNQLASVALPNAVNTIGHYAFNNNRMTSVTLPNAVNTIGKYAFNNNRMTSVTLPNTLTSIGEGAFLQNGTLTQVHFTGPVPAMITGADHAFPSLGGAAGLTVAFPSRYLDQEGQPGYTAPKWLGYSALPAYTVSFDTGGGSAVDPVTGWPGDTLELPNPVRRGYTFTGWYTTPDLANRFDSELPLTGDLTVHAGWQPNSVPATPLTPAGSSLSGGSIDDYLPAGYGS